jgi:hypothetical protein
VIATVEEMQELLLMGEEEHTWREDALAMREENARVFKKALKQVSATLDMERAKDKASRQEYLGKIQTHINHGNHVPDLDNMLGERKEEPNGRERDLELRVAALVEAQALGPNPRDNCDELMEFVELCGLL